MIFWCSIVSPLFIVAVMISGNVEICSILLDNKALLEAADKVCKG